MVVGIVRQGGPVGQSMTFLTPDEPRFPVLEKKYNTKV